MYNTENFSAFMATTIQEDDDYKKFTTRLKSMG